MDLGGPAWSKSSRRRRRRRILFRIVHAQGAIPDEVGPTRCRAKPASISQPTKRRRREEEETQESNLVNLEREGSPIAVACAGAGQPSGEEDLPLPTHENCSTKARTIPLLLWLCYHVPLTRNAN